MAGRGAPLKIGSRVAGRPAVVGVRRNLRARALNETLLVHEVLDLAGDELAGADVQVVGADLLQARLGLERRQESLHDELADTDLVADVVEDVLGGADRAGLHAVRRGGQPDDADVRIDHLGVGDELPVHPVVLGGDHVRFVDDDQIDRPEVARFLPDALDARDRDGVAEVFAFQARRVNAHRHV